MKHYQGDDIPFELTLKNGKWSDFDCVDIYFFTNESNVVKFSTANENYNSLIINDNKISGVISSENTSLMCGNITIEIRLRKNGQDLCKRVNSNVNVFKTIIKIETYD